MLKAKLERAHQNERQAARFRALAANATTPSIKARLIREAEEY